MDQVLKLTNQWKNEAIFLGDDALASRLIIVDLGAKSSFYHKRCSTVLYNDYMKKLNKHGKSKINIDHGINSLLA